MLRVVLDVGHTLASGGRPPARHGDLLEHRLAMAYAVHAFEALEQAGAAVGLVAAGRYRTRQDLGTQIADAYIACHINAGGGTYGLCLYDQRSRQGRALAERVASSMSLAWVPRTISSARHAAAMPEDDRGVRHWTANALELIKHVYPGRACGLVYEPGFLDNPDHQLLWTPDGLREVGHVLARGVLAWAQGRGLT